MFLLFLFATLRKIPRKTVTCLFFLLAASGGREGEIHVFLPPSCFSPSPRLAGSARSSKCPLITLTSPRPSPRQLESEKQISYFRFRISKYAISTGGWTNTQGNEIGMACCCRWGLFVEGVHFELQSSTSSPKHQQLGKQEQTLFNDLRRIIKKWKKKLVTQKQGGSSLTMISEWGGVWPPFLKTRGSHPILKS